MLKIKICITVVLYFIFCSAITFADQKENSISDVIDIYIDDIYSKSGLRFAYKNLPKSETDIVLYSSVSDKELELLFRYIKLIHKEISKYPPSFFKKVKLQKIYFVKKLFHNKKPVEGMYNHKHDVMILDFLRSRGNPLKQKHVFHHELFHVIGLNTKGYKVNKDRIWDALNSPGFKYGKVSYQIHQKNEVNAFAPAKMGFMTDYSMTSIEEDKAEMFACLMIKSQHKLALSWSKKDEVLRKKLAFIKDFIFRFNNEMDSEYWDNISRGMRYF